MTKQEFFALVRRHNAGDADAIRELRKFADDPRMRREAVKRAPSHKTRPRRSMSSKPAAAGPQLRMPPRGRFIRSAILDAIEILGIERPIQIRWANADNMAAPKPGYRMNGEHEFTAEGSHIIKLLPGRSAEATTRTLLHELAHCLQAEGFGTRTRWARAKLDNASRFEADADELARVLGHLKLVK